MNNDTHDVEALELYALGALDGDEAATVEQHVRSCASCAQRLGRAEETVTALLEMQHGSRRRPGWWTGAAAIAAAMLLWLAPIGLLGVQVANLRSERAAQTTALAAIVHSHFLHAPFAPAAAASAPAAKVLYGRTDPWLYVIADTPENGLRVGVRERGETRLRDIGALQNHGSAATLFARVARAREVVLLRGGAVVARAVLVGKND